VWDVARGEHVIGRFGWKANQPSLRQQAAAAFHGDIGITSSLFPEGSDEPEVSDADLEKLVFYLRTLAVPARRDVDDPLVQQGEQLFVTIGCARCHVPSMRTRPDAALPQLSNQNIQPFTDLLLHDMGEDLADGRPDYDADGRQWRTPPLWGLGLLHEVNGHTYLLHDGRARNTEEAILWHGGEGQTSRQAYRHLTRDERAALLKFLSSL
jgi:CxxC motif-containing protein (DUF1111 family)